MGFVAKSFNESITRLLSERLAKFIQKELDLRTCVEIYQTIFATLADVFQTSDVMLTNESMNYLAQLYYDCAVINDNQELNPNIFSERAKLSNIATKELALLAMMLKGTELSYEFLHEIKKRS